jgi:hypothetical protein
MGAIQKTKVREARNASDVRRRILQADVSKREVSSTALRNEEYLKMVKLWDEETPHGLQHNTNSS